METNKQVITGENNLPEVIQDKKGVIVAVLGNNAAHRNLARDINNAAIAMATAVEKAQQVFPKKH